MGPTIAQIVGYIIPKTLEFKNYRHQCIETVVNPHVHVAPIFKINIYNT